MRELGTIFVAAVLIFIFGAPMMQSNLVGHEMPFRVVILSRNDERLGLN